MEQTTVWKRPPDVVRGNAYSAPAQQEPDNVERSVPLPQRIRRSRTVVAARRRSVAVAQNRKFCVASRLGYSSRPSHKLILNC